MKQGEISIRTLLTGLLVIVAGVLLYLFNSGYLPEVYRPVVFSWPSLLVAIGFSILFSRHSWFLGIFMMLLGGFFLLKKVDIEGLSFITQNGWTVILVIIGFVIMHKALVRKRFYRCSQSDFHEFVDDVKQELSEELNSDRKCHHRRRNDSGYIRRDSVFGGSKEKVDYAGFRGGEVNCVFGGIELDLSDSLLAEGIHKLEFNAVFGGIVLYVPVDWNIEIHQTQVFGSFVDNRPAPGFEIKENSTLILEVASVFGGGEIKCKNK